MAAGGDRSAQGKTGEALAADYLRAHGLEILQRNWKSRSGEIDLIARDGDAVVFVEVKARATERWGEPEDAVTAAKRRRLIRTAREFAHRHKILDRPLRFDVVAVLFDGDKPQVRHYPNAFTPRDAHKRK